jgi:hypothetical protein
MKKIFLALFVFTSIAASAQYDSTKVRQPVGAYGFDWKNGKFTGSVVIPADTVAMAVADSGAIASKGGSIWGWNGYKWEETGISQTIIDSLISNNVKVKGTAITSLPTIGRVPNATNISDWIDSVFYQSMPPTATLSGGTTLEYQAAGTVTKTLNWTAGRQSATDSLATIVVAGTNESFSQPAQSASVSGTQAVSFAANTNVTYSNVVTTTDNKTATATTTFSFASKYYVGYVSSATPTDANIIAALGTTTGGAFASSRLTSGTLANPASSNYIIFAYPASFGTGSIKINGLIVGYNLITRSFTNASGYATSYNIYVSPFPTSGGVDFQVL